MVDGTPLSLTPTLLFWCCTCHRPPQVSNLSLLVSLKLRKNQLTAVTPEVFLLESLSLLDLTGNAIRELPEDSLGAAIALKGLLLSGAFRQRNRCTTAPDCPSALCVRCVGQQGRRRGSGVVCLSCRSAKPLILLYRQDLGLYIGLCGVRVLWFCSCASCCIEDGVEISQSTHHKLPQLACASLSRGAHVSLLPTRSIPARPLRALYRV